MKRIFSLLISTGVCLSAIAQQSSMPSISDTAKPKKSFAGDSLLGRWVIDINLHGGALTQDITTAPTSGNYLSGLNLNTGGSLKFDNGMAYGFDGQLGFFFGKKRHFGLGTGFMYQMETGDLKIDNYHVEYQSKDKNGDIYRQLVTANGGVTEHLQTTNMSIPLVLKYKKRFGKVVGFTGDVGVLFNLKMSNEYNTNANFDYEAIYRYEKNAQGNYVAVYDNNATPATVGDILYTKAEYTSKNPGLNVNTYFNSTLPSKGYYTGLGITPTNKTGTVSYATGSVAFIIRPALNFFLSDNVALNLGVYFMYQPNTNTVSDGYTLTNKVGEYNSLLHTVSSSTNQSYGANIGVRFFLGSKHKPEIPQLPITDDATNPSYCGLCDGAITFHNLIPGQVGMVNYLYNGTATQSRMDTVSPFGTLRLSNLCAGEYANILLTMNGETRFAPTVNLVNPQIRNYSESYTNPTEAGKSDGSMTIHGLKEGLKASVKYNYKGASKTVNNTVGTDGTVSVSGLSAGTYSSISVTINSCTANVKDMTLTDPIIAAPVEAKVPEITTPILFETNRTVIMKSSYVVLEAAKKKMDADKAGEIIVDGYTDITGKASYNKVLSLKRAKAVKDKLIEMGIDPKRIKVVGHGSKNPTGDNTTPEGRLENRRAVMHLNVGDLK